METKRNENIKDKYIAAVDDFVAKIRKDINVVAVVIQGSLTNDVVWEKSDIDCCVVIRDQKITAGGFCLDQDGIAFNVEIVGRTEFIRDLQKSEGGSGGHSMYAKSEIVYTTDPSLRTILDDCKKIGERDMERSAMVTAGEIVYYWEKCQKWLFVKDDPTYCRYYVLKAADAIARMEICLAFEPSSREAVLRADILSPALMKKYYHDPISREMSREELTRLLDDIDEYIMSKADLFMIPMNEYLADGEIRSVGMIAKHFRTGAHFLVHLLDYAAHKGLVEKAGLPVRLTPKSRPALEEAAYFIPKTEE